MDVIDKKILRLVQQDARMTNKEMALKLQMSVTAVYERIRKLEREGVVKKYVALLDRTKIEKAFVVFCHVKLIQHAKDYLMRFESEVIKLPEVLECFHVSGDYDYILKIAVKDMETYRDFMVTKLTGLQHIGSTHSSFMIGEIKNSTAFEMESH
jgi:Lrp/AsnC family leucine-responsive transcriptional regulator